MTTTVTRIHHPKTCLTLRFGLSLRLVELSIYEPAATTAHEQLEQNALL